MTTTLIFSIAIAGNLANFFQHDHSSSFKWHYDFHLVTSAAVCIILYVCLMPLAVWSILKWSVKFNDDIDLDIETVSRIHLTRIKLTLTIISGSLRSKSLVNRLSLRIFVGCLCARVNPLDNSGSIFRCIDCTSKICLPSGFLLAMATGANCSVPFWICPCQLFVTSFEALKIFIFPNHWNRFRTFSSCGWIYAENFPCRESCGKRGYRGRHQSRKCNWLGGVLLDNKEYI